jgi:hypothetical protein
MPYLQGILEIKTSDETKSVQHQACVNLPGGEDAECIKKFKPSIAFTSKREK